MDVLILVGDPTCQHRVGIAKECASILRGKSIQAEISATAGDCETFSQEKITSRIIIAVASPGLQFNAHKVEVVKNMTLFQIRISFSGGACLCCHPARDPPCDIRRQGETIERRKVTREGSKGVNK